MIHNCYVCLSDRSNRNANPFGIYLLLFYLAAIHYIAGRMRTAAKKCSRFSCRCSSCYKPTILLMCSYFIKLLLTIKQEGCKQLPGNEPKPAATNYRQHQGRKLTELQNFPEKVWKFNQNFCLFQYYVASIFVKGPVLD